MRVLIVVTHLLGTGHLARALVLARALQTAGQQVRVVSGGRAVPHLDRGDIEIVQLPPLQSDGTDFVRLLDGDGALATDQRYAERQTMLQDALTDYAPDVLITELFPFGRRTLKAEFLALLAAAKVQPTPPLICASIRDILAPPSKPAKADFADEIIATYYDAVLVHSDPEVTPLDLSWPVRELLAPKLWYTGFVAPPAPLPHPDGLGQGEVLVSAGGGDVGGALFDCALRAAALAPETKWRLFVGGDVAAVAADAPANVIVSPTRPDFRQMLHHARASVSMCGYNTALDILQTGCPALFVPFDAGGEVEQTLRATALAKRDAMQMLSAQELTPEQLLTHLRALQSAPRPAPKPDGFDGARRSVSILQDLMEQRG